MRLAISRLSKGRRNLPEPRLMPARFRIITAWIAIFAFAGAARLHLPVVQLAAWTVMAANYAEMMPADEAILRAVGGEELCGACRYVRSADHARQTRDALVSQSLSAEQPPALDARPDDLPTPPAPRLIGVRRLVPLRGVARRDPPEHGPPRLARA